MSFTNYGNKYKFKALNRGGSKSIVKLQYKKKDGTWSNTIESETYGNETPEDVRRRMENNNNKEYRIVKDNKFSETSLEELHKLRGELAEKENHLQILNTWYNNERDDKSRKGILKDIKSVELKIKEIKNKMTDIKNKARLKDSMDMLKLMGWTTDADPFGVVYREGDFKIKYNQKEDSYELYFNSIYYNTYHTLAQAKQEIEKYKERKKLRGKDSCGEKVYTKGESTDGCKDGGPGSGIKGHTGGEPMARLSKKWTPENINHIMRNPHLYREEVVEEAARKALENKGLLKKAKDDADPDIQYKEFMANKKKPLTYSEGKKLLEEAKKAGIHQDYLKGMERGLASLKDDDATEMGSFEQLGQNHETEAMEPEEHPVLAQDAYNRSDWENVERHPWTIKELEYQIGTIRSRLEMNKKNIVALRQMVNSGNYGSLTKADLRKEEADYEANQMKIKQLVSMLQRAKGQKDSMISEVLNPLKESWSKIKELSTEDASNPDWNVGNFDWNVSNFNGQWYITKNGQKFKGPFPSMEEAARYLDGHKWELEYKLGKSKTEDSDPRIAEANKLINLFGGVK